MNNHKNTIIIGGGLSGLVVAHKLKSHNPGHKILVLEKADQTGGVIKSFRDHGYLAEIGPHGFLDNCPESRQILEETGLDNEKVMAPLSEFVRYVCIDGALKMIPQSPLKIIRAPLIPWKDKFRVLQELFKSPLEGEPTVAKWADYRFGPAVLPYVDAVFTGTYAGDYNELKIDAVMPGVRELEKQHGSLLRGMLAKARESRKASPGKKLTMPAMTSFPTGMQRLPEKLTENLEKRDELVLNCCVEALTRINNHWSLKTTNGEFTCDNVVLALPTNQSLPLLDSLLPGIPLKRIPEAWIATVVFGFENGSLPPGFGFLTPECENRFSLGTLFSSNMFPNRAPGGHIVFETLIGGRRHPERLELDDNELIEKSLTDIRELIDLPPTPAYTKVLRPKGGIPQLESGYTRLLEWRRELLKQNKTLYICGFGWEGIGINDMIKSATKVALKVQSGRPQEQAATEVKKVYF